MLIIAIGFTVSSACLQHCHWPKRNDAQTNHVDDGSLVATLSYRSRPLGYIPKVTAADLFGSEADLLVTEPDLRFLKQTFWLLNQTVWLPKQIVWLPKHSCRSRQ